MTARLGLTAGAWAFRTGAGKAAQSAEEVSMGQETRRHNGFGVDLTGTGENLDRAMVALNSHADLLAACEALIGYAEEGGRNLASDAKDGVEGADEASEGCQATLKAAWAALAKARGDSL